jgi:hypothetical protein
MPFVLFFLCLNFQLYVQYRVPHLVFHSMLCFSVFWLCGVGSGFLGPRAGHAPEWRYILFYFG